MFLDFFKFLYILQEDFINEESIGILVMDLGGRGGDLFIVTGRN